MFGNGNFILFTLEIFKRKCDPVCYTCVKCMLGNNIRNLENPFVIGNFQVSSVITQKTLRTSSHIIVSVIIVVWPRGIYGGNMGSCEIYMTCTMIISYSFAL